MSIHIGQAGIQIGNACWERFAIEHGINVDGTLKPDFDQCAIYKDGPPVTFFEAASEGRYIPRSLLIDLEQTVIGMYYHILKLSILYFLLT